MDGQGRGDTIFAPSTAAGRAGVSVIRVSGPEAGAALQALGGPASPVPRRAVLCSFRDPDSGETIDRGLGVWFPGPGSFTGEDVAEFHVHGGRAVVAAMLDALGRRPGLRPAEAGEFTRRAFDNGKLDLAEVEGLADLVNAETEMQRRQALRQMGGALSRRVEGWRERLVRALAHLEAEIDFPDEDVPEGLSDRVRERVAALEGEVASFLADDHRGERLRDGVMIAIVGAPNVGKSSLLNALARRDAAIVASTAGTTRDVIEVHLDLGGLPVTLADTAGLRDVGAGDPRGLDPVEREGIRRSLERAAAADLKLAVFDRREWPPGDPETRALLDGDCLILLNKCDLVSDRELSVSKCGGMVPVAEGLEFEPLELSARSGAGLERLLQVLREACAARVGSDGGAITRARHRAALEDCRAALGRARQAALAELAAEDLRLATRALGRVTGRVDVEDVLDAVFRDFCIGK